MLLLLSTVSVYQLGNIRLHHLCLDNEYQESFTVVLRCWRCIIFIGRPRDLSMQPSICPASISSLQLTASRHPDYALYYI